MVSEVKIYLHRANARNPVDLAFPIENAFVVGDDPPQVCAPFHDTSSHLIEPGGSGRFVRVNGGEAEGGEWVVFPGRRQAGEGVSHPSGIECRRDAPEKFRAVSLWDVQAGHIVFGEVVIVGPCLKKCGRIDWPQPAFLIAFQQSVLLEPANNSADEARAESGGAGEFSAP